MLAWLFVVTWLALLAVCVVLALGEQLRLPVWCADALLAVALGSAMLLPPRLDYV